MDANPGQASTTPPWLRKPEWVSGVIPDHIVRSTLLAWCVLLLVGGGTAPIFLDVSRELHHGNYSHVWFALIFLAIDVGLILWVIQSTARVTKFGKSFLHLETIPAIPGGSLAGAIRVSKAIKCEGGLRLKLNCVHLTPAGTRRSDGFFEENIWHAEQTLDHFPTTMMGSEIPIFFHIPADAQPSDDSDFESQFVWRLEARAKSGEINYSSRFDVPVFANPSATLPAAAVDHAAPFRKKEIAVLPQQMMNAPGITCVPLAGGGLEIQFGSARNKRVALMATFFGLLLAGIMVAMVYVARLETFIVFRILWYIAGAGLTGLIALFILYAAVCAWFVTSDITINHGSLHLSKGIWIFRRRLTLTAEQITSVACVTSGSAGADTYFAIELSRPENNIPIRVADFIPQQEYASRLANEIFSRLGIQ
jgi:hypothetical protein